LTANEQTGTLDLNFSEDEIDDTPWSFGYQFGWEDKDCECENVELDRLTLHTQSTGPELEFGETPPPYPDENVPSDSDFEDKFITDWERRAINR
jgi:hypothetical protein